MNLNDFVVLPNKKAISVKLNSRDLQELQMETLTLSQQNTHMEEKLLQLRRTMSREKEQRGHSGGFRWKSSQGGSAAANTKKDRDDKLQKLSAGKVKIRVLKDEPMTILPQPPAQPVGPNRTRRSRLRGVVCGQCEVRSAGLKCAECSENFCVPCFVKFHQKGALKLHRMIPIKTELQTAVSTQEVVGVNPSISSKPGDLSPEGGEAAKSPHVHFHPDQVSGCSLSEEENKRSPPSLLRGDFDEEESTKSFQEALRQWRGGQTNGTADPGNDAAWTPAGPGSVSATATQADLSEDEEAEGGGRGRGRGTVPVRVEFTPNHSYMDRLLLKKHRRTPVELYKSYLSWMLELKFLPEENSVEEKEETRKVEVEEEEEQVELSLTAQEEEFHRYYASLFAVPVSGGSTEAPVRSPGHHLVVEVLDELDGDGNHGNSEDQTEPNAATKLDFSEPSSSANTTPGSTTAPPTVGSSGRSSTVHSPSQLKPETTDKLRPPGPPTAGAGGLMKTSASRTVTSPHGAVRSPRTTSQENLRSSARVCRSDCFSSSKLMSSSPRPQDQIRPNSQCPQSCCPSPEPNQRRWSSSSTRPSLRSTFTISPFSSAQSPLLPRVHTPTACPSDRCLSNTSSVLSFPRSPEPPLLQTPPPNSQLTAALTPASSPTTSLFNESPSDASLRRTSTTTDGGAAPPASSTSGGHDLTEHGTAPITAPPSPPPSPPSSPPLNMKPEEELLIDSEDEMSCDSLGLTFHEEDSSEEEEEDEETPGRSPRATNQHPSDEKVKGRHSDEPQQLSHGSTLIQGWSDGSEPQQFWDVRDRSPQCPDPSPGSSDETRHTPSAPKWMCSPGPAVSCPLVSSPLPASKLSSSCCCSSSSPPPPPPPPAPAPGLPPLVSDSELLPSFRPLSRAALEIMEICSVDQTGCEDPDLDNETTAYHLHNLEQELQRVTKDTGTRIMLPAERAAPSGKLPRVPVTEEQREEEEAAQMDRQSVLLLP